MSFSYSAVWDDTIALARAHGTLVAALAGVFMFLPSLLSGYFLPRPEPSDFSQLARLIIEYWQANWHWLLLEMLVGMTGALAILMLVFARAGITVAAAIAAAGALLPFYFLANLLSFLIIWVGLVLLVVPGLYLLGRLVPLGPVVVAEQRRNPVDAIRRTFEVTRDKGWAVLGLFLIVAITASVAVMVVNSILGIVFVLVAGRDLGGLLALIVASATAAAFSALLVLLYAAIYRRLAPDASAAAAAAGTAGAAD
jgi:hypothetical protein